MRIAILHTQYKAKGGMEAYLFNLLRQLLDAGDEVDLFVQKRDREAPALPGLNVITLATTRFFSRRARYLRFLNKLKDSFDPSSYDLSLSLTRSECQDVVICGGTHLGYLQGMKKDLTKADQSEVQLEQRAYESSRVVVAHSPQLKRELVGLYNVPEEKVRVLLPPVDPSRFGQHVPVDLNALAERLNVDRTKRNILFPSSGHTRKGFYELLDAFSRLSPQQYQLLVAGDTSLEAKRFPHVRYLGYVDNLQDYLRLSDFMILPSHYEPYGMVVPEALCCRTPVILSRNVGALDTLEESERELIYAVNPQAIVEAIERAYAREFHIRPPFARDSSSVWSKHIAALKELSELATRVL